VIDIGDPVERLETLLDELEDALRKVREVAQEMKAEDDDEPDTAARHA